MSQRFIFVLAGTALLTGCAGKASESFHLDSKPTSADVYVMGEKIGTTPIDIPKSKVFPNVYAPEKQSLYGRVTLRKSSCEEREIPIGLATLADGSVVKLECAAPSTAGPVAPVAKDVATRLKELEQLHRDGLVTDAEYAAQRQRILSEL